MSPHHNAAAVWEPCVRAVPGTAGLGASLLLGVCCCFSLHFQYLQFEIP